MISVDDIEQKLCQHSHKHAITFSPRDLEETTSWRAKDHTPRIKRVVQQQYLVYYRYKTTFYKALRIKEIVEMCVVKKSYYFANQHHLKQFNVSQWYEEQKDEWF